MRLNSLELLPALLDAWIVKLNVPAAAGAPLRRPVDEFSETPLGRPPPTTLHVIGELPVAESGWV